MLVVELALPGQPAPAPHKPLEAACGQGLAFKSPNKGLKMWLQARPAAHDLTCCTLEDTQILEPLESWNLRLLLSETLNHRQHQNDSLNCYPCASHPPKFSAPYLLNPETQRLFSCWNVAINESQQLSGALQCWARLAPQISYQSHPSWPQTVLLGPLGSLRCWAP